MAVDTLPGNVCKRRRIIAAQIVATDTHRRKLHSLHSMLYLDVAIRNRGLPYGSSSWSPPKPLPCESRMVHADRKSRAVGVERPLACRDTNAVTVISPTPSEVVCRLACNLHLNASPHHAQLDHRLANSATWNVGNICTSLSLQVVFTT